MSGGIQRFEGGDSLLLRTFEEQYMELCKDRHTRILDICIGYDLWPYRITKRTIPERPENVTVYSVDENAVHLTWSKPACRGGKEVVDYLIEYKKTNSSEWEKKTTSSSNSECHIDGLSPGYEYDFRVLAKNETGLSEPSEVIRKEMPHSLNYTSLLASCLYREIVRDVQRNAMRIVEVPPLPTSNLIVLSSGTPEVLSVIEALKRKRSEHEIFLYYLDNVITPTSLSRTERYLEKAIYIEPESYLQRLESLEKKNLTKILIERFWKEKEKEAGFRNHKVLRCIAEIAETSNQIVSLQEISSTVKESDFGGTISLCFLPGLKSVLETSETLETNGVLFYFCGLRSRSKQCISETTFSDLFERYSACSNKLAEDILLEELHLSLSVPSLFGVFASENSFQDCSDIILLQSLNACDLQIWAVDGNGKASSQRKPTVVEERVSAEIPATGEVEVTELNSSCHSSTSLEFEQDVSSFDVGGTTSRTSQLFVDKKNGSIQVQGRNKEATTRTGQWSLVKILLVVTMAFLSLASLSEACESMNHERSNAGRLIYLLEMQGYFLALDLRDCPGDQNCCGAVDYNIDNAICCINEKEEVKLNPRLHGVDQDCCGLAVFNKSSHYCTKTPSFVTPSNIQYHTGTSYDTNKQVPCDDEEGTLLDLPDNQNVRYPITYKCCNKTLTDVDSFYCWFADQSLKSRENPRRQGDICSGNCPPKERPELCGTGNQFWSGVQLDFCDNENGTVRNCCKGRNKTDLLWRFLKDERMVGYPNDAKVRNKTAEWNDYRHQHWVCTDSLCLFAIILVYIGSKARETVLKGNSTSSSLFAKRALLLASCMCLVDGSYAGSVFSQHGFGRSTCDKCYEICDPTIMKMRCETFCKSHCTGECITHLAKYLVIGGLVLGFVVHLLCFLNVVRAKYLAVYKKALMLDVSNSSHGGNDVCVVSTLTCNFPDDWGGPGAQPWQTVRIATGNGHTEDVAKVHQNGNPRKNQKKSHMANVRLSPSGNKGSSHRSLRLNNDSSQTMPKVLENSSQMGWSSVSVESQTTGPDESQTLSKRLYTSKGEQGNFNNMSPNTSPKVVENKSVIVKSSVGSQAMVRDELQTGPRNLYYSEAPHNFPVTSTCSEVGLQTGSLDSPYYQTTTIPEHFGHVGSHGSAQTDVYNPHKCASSQTSVATSKSQTRQDESAKSLISSKSSNRDKNHLSIKDTDDDDIDESDENSMLLPKDVISTANRPVLDLDETERLLTGESARDQINFERSRHLNLIGGSLTESNLNVPCEYELPPEAGQGDGDDDDTEEKLNTIVKVMALGLAISEDTGMFSWSLLSDRRDLRGVHELVVTGATNTTDTTATAVRNHYAKLRQRIESFSAWPRDVTQTPRQLAEAGFFHAESSGDDKDQEAEEHISAKKGHKIFKDDHKNNYSQADMIEEEQRHEEETVHNDLHTAKANHFAVTECKSGEFFQQPHLVPKHYHPDLDPDKVTRHSTEISACVQIYSRTASKLHLLKNAPHPKIFTSVKERVKDELTDRNESNVNDVTFEIKRPSFRSFSVSTRPLDSDDEDEIKELSEDLYTSSNSVHTSFFTKEEVPELIDESLCKSVVDDKVIPHDSKSEVKTLSRTREQEDDDTANAVDRNLHIYDHVMSKRKREDDYAETDKMILNTFSHSCSSERVWQKTDIKTQRLRMICFEEEIAQVKVKGSLERRNIGPPLLNHSLDRSLFNESIVKPRDKREEDDDCSILRSITWLPLDDLPVPDIYTSISVHNAAQVILNRIASGETVGAQESMKFEILRVCTYRNYPSEDKPFRISFSSAGMYYASDRDEVVCYSCGLRKSGWKEADSPLEVHKQIKPNCDFFVKHVEVNIPIPELEREQLLKFKTLDDLLNSSTRSPLDRTQLGDERTAGNHCNFDLNTSESPLYRFFIPPPKHPQYAVQSVRLESFKGWPTNIPQTAPIMAECGYYYAGFGDCVRCFHCGIGLRHWTEEDYPWVEHARWSKDCAYLRQMKGEEFIQNVHLAIEEDEEPEDLIPATPSGQPADMSQVTPNEDSNQILLTDPAQSVLEMGYQPRIIKKAIDIILRTEGRSGISAMKIMEKIFMLEERSDNLEQGVANMNISGAGANTEVQSQNSSGTDQTQNNGGRSQVPNTGTGQLAQSCSTKNQSQRNDGLALTQNSSTSQAQGNIASGQTSSSNISHTQSKPDNESPAQRGTNVKSTDTIQAKAATKRPLTTEKQNEAAASPTASPHSSLEGNVKGATSGKSQSLKDTTKIKAENQKLKEQTICKVCLDKPVSIVFLPCGHLVTCAECAPAMKKCPICRALVKGSVKAFMS